MKIGIHNCYASKDWDADYYDLIKSARKVGADVLECHAGRFYEMSKTQREELKKLAADNDVELTFCYGLPKQYNLTSPDEEKRMYAVKYVQEVLKAVGEMGGTMFSGCNYSYWPYDYNNDTHDREKLREISAKSVKEVIKVAEDFDIDYCFETLNRFEHIMLNTTAEGIEFCKRIDSPKAKLNLDTFHMNIEEDSITGALIAAKDYLVDVHVGERNRRYPGMGDMPWEDIFQALKSINYEKYIVMEPFMITGGEIGRNVYLWRDLTNNASREQLDKMAKDSVEFMKGLANN